MTQRTRRPTVPRGHVRRGDPARVGMQLGFARSTLTQLRTLEAVLDGQVVEARAAGATWTQIGDLLGMTAKSAWKRYAEPGEPRRRVVKGGASAA